MDDIVQRLAFALAVPRLGLHIVSAGKGLVAGRLFLTARDSHHEEI